MTLQEVYKSLGLDEKTAVRIYQTFTDVEDEIVVFDNVINDTDIVPSNYMKYTIWWFTWHPMIEWLEVHLENCLINKEEK